jgi:flagellin
MGFRINTNTSSLAANRTLTKTARNVEKTTKHLASGSRIAEAGDDAAGLAISEKIKSVIRSSVQARRNATDGISMVQMAEGGINEIQNIMTRLRELSIQSASDTIGNTERELTNLEYQQLKNEIERISQVTEFNGRKLLDGTGSRYDFQVDVNSGEMDRISFNAGATNMSLSRLNLDSLDVSNKSGAQNSLSNLDNAIEQVSRQRSSLGAIQSRLTSSTNNLSIFEKSQSDANSRIRDTDYAFSTAAAAKNSIIQQSGTQVMAQANTTGSNALKLLS